MTVIKFQRPKSKQITDNIEINKLNLKIDFVAKLSDLINTADGKEYDERLKKGHTHRCFSHSGNEYIITITKINNSGE